MDQNNLLIQIQAEVVSHDADLSSILRRCMILAQRLALPEFKQWVQNELNGYADNASLPDYRTLETPHHLGHFNGWGGSQIKNGQIPVTEIPAELRPFLLKRKFLAGVRAIGELLTEPRGQLHIAWPIEAVRIMNQVEIYEGHALVQGICVINHSQIHGLLDQIRNRLLNFVLEIESTNPDAGKAVMNSNTIPENTVRNIFNTTILGGTQNLAQASHHFSQHAQTQVAVGDIKALNKALAEIGLSKKRVTELKGAIEADRAEGTKGIGRRVTEWIGTIAMKAGSEGLKIASDVAVNAITQALKSYYGLPSS